MAVWIQNVVSDRDQVAGCSPASRESGVPACCWPGEKTDSKTDSGGKNRLQSTVAFTFWLVKVRKSLSQTIITLWRRLLRVPWIARRANQSILTKLSPEYSLEGLMQSWNSNTLATWCEELTRLKRPWFWERLKVGGEGDDKGWDDKMASRTWWTRVWISSGSWWTGMPGVLQPVGLQRARHDWATALNWRLLC